MERTAKSGLVPAGFVPGEGRPPAPGDLSREEADVWEATVEAMPPGWFTEETFPLLRAYCIHSALHRVFTAELKNLLKMRDIAPSKLPGHEPRPRGRPRLDDPYRQAKRIEIIRKGKRMDAVARMKNIDAMTKMQAREANTIAMLAQKLRLCQSARIPHVEAEARARNQTRAKPWQG